MLLGPCFQFLLAWQHNAKCSIQNATTEVPHKMNALVWTENKSCKYKSLHLAFAIDLDLGLDLDLSKPDGRYFISIVHLGLNLSTTKKNTLYQHWLIVIVFITFRDSLFYLNYPHTLHKVEARIWYPTNNISVDTQRNFSKMCEECLLCVHYVSFRYTLLIKINVDTMIGRLELGCAKNNWFQPAVGILTILHELHFKWITL